MFINFNKISQGESLQQQQEEYCSFFNTYDSIVKNALQDFEQQKKLIYANVEDLSAEDLLKLEQIIVDRFIAFGKGPLSIATIKKHQELLQEELETEEILKLEKHITDLLEEEAYYRDKCYCFTASREVFFKNYDLAPYKQKARLFSKSG